MQIRQFARLAQNYAVRVSEFVRKDCGQENSATDDKRAVMQRLPDVTNARKRIRNSGVLLTEHGRHPCRMPHDLQLSRARDKEARMGWVLQFISASYLGVNKCRIETRFWGW